MNSSKTVIRIAGAFLALLAFAGCGPRKDKEPPKPKVTAALPVLGPAPSWQLKDVSGATVSSEQFKGKVVVVDFWATWCGPCRVEIPGYTELQKKYGDKGLVIVGMSVDEAGAEVVKQFGQRNNVNYPLVMADEAVQAAFGGIEAIPTTFLIDRDGQIRDRKLGAMETAEYEKKVVALLN